MDELISRQAAIDAAIEAADDWDGGYSITRSNMIENAIKALPSAQQWIPVTERLPIPNERIGNVRKYYLIQNEYGDMMVACYSGEWEQIYRHEYCLDKVVAWMPLPMPWEGEEE